MLDVSNKLKTYILAGWTETNPAAASVAFTFDEYNPNDPKTQILFENLTDKKTWLTKGIYRLEQECKITIFLRPANYSLATITATKTTYGKIKTEVDKILSVGRFIITGLNSVGLNGWKDLGLEVGRDGNKEGSKEPIVFTSEQVVNCIYYEGS